MTVEQLNTAIYEKMNEEMKQFAAWLLTQPAEEVLNHAYEYVTKQDILSDMEYLELSEDRARALLQSGTPLEDVYKAYDSQGPSVMDIITDCIENRADAIIEQNIETADVPVYPYSGDYAEEHDELEQYRESKQLNISCKAAIQSAIAEHYDGKLLDPEAVHKVVAQFGVSRISFVLVNTIQQKDYDGRISPRNKAWARPFTIYPDSNHFGHDQRLRYVVDSHPGLTDVFVNTFRKEYCHEHQVQKVKPSVVEKLKNQQPQKTSPKISAKLKGQER